MRPKPMDLDDDEKALPRRSAVFAVGKVVCLIGACVVAGIALFDPQVKNAVGMVGVACVAGIAARICQAEEHRD